MAVAPCLHKGKEGQLLSEVCSVMMWYRDSPSPGNTLARCTASNWNGGSSQSSLHHVGYEYLQLFRGSYLTLKLLLPLGNVPGMTDHHPQISIATCMDIS